MSKSVEERKQVFSIINKSLQNQSQQIHDMQMILQEVSDMRDDIVKDRETVIELAKQIKDENRLLPAEIDDLYNAVVSKSIDLAKDRNDEDTEEFKKVVGKYRRFIWSKLKRHNGTSKYIHTKRVDFEPSLEFVRTFNPENYI